MAIIARLISSPKTLSQFVARISASGAGYDGPTGARFGFHRAQSGDILVLAICTRLACSSNGLSPCLFKLPHWAPPGGCVSNLVAPSCAPENATLALKNSQKHRCHVCLFVCVAAFG
ncbi:hypothetical protein DPSP01_012079 [Paraphaeosphaeria sporulosa]